MNNVHELPPREDPMQRLQQKEKHERRLRMLVYLYILGGSTAAWGMLALALVGLLR